MAGEVTPVPIVASIEAGPSTSGFLRGGREVSWDVDLWRDEVNFTGGPCEAPGSYPNKDAACLPDSLVDTDVLTEADPKGENGVTVEGPFFPWTIYDNIVCRTSDTNRDRTKVLAKRRLEQVRSSKFAQEISGGGYSGSLSFQSSAVPLSDTAYSLTVAIQRLVDARVSAEAPGPHIIHLPSVLAPLAGSLTLSSTEDYKIVFDNYVKSYVPSQNISGGGAATAPTSSQAWAAITGPYEYTFAPIGEPSVAETLDAKRNNALLVQAEQKLFYRFDTCNTFLAKVTVYS